jgi:large subunit ribosomal protein L23
MEKSPYSIIKCRHITEKASVLANLEKAESNICLKRCKTPKLVFKVDRNATKKEIAQAVEQIYAKKKIKVTAVNTILVKPKVKQKRIPGSRIGATKVFKKAIVSLRPGDVIDEQV